MELHINYKRVKLPFCLRLCYQQTPETWYQSRSCSHWAINPACLRELDCRLWGKKPGLSFTEAMSQQLTWLLCRSSVRPPVLKVLSFHPWRMNPPVSPAFCLHIKKQLTFTRAARSTSSFTEHHVALWWVSPLGLNRTILVCEFDLNSHICHFEESLLCAGPMSTIAPLETAAAAACCASSYLWLHAAWVELGGDRSSHSGRHSPTADSGRIWLELKASHSVWPSIQIKKIKWAVWLQGSSMDQDAWDWSVPIRVEAQIYSPMQDTFCSGIFFFLLLMYWITFFCVEWKEH